MFYVDFPMVSKPGFCVAEKQNISRNIIPIMTKVGFCFAESQNISRTFLLICALKRDVITKLLSFLNVILQVLETLVLRYDKYDCIENPIINIIRVLFT